MRLSAAIMAHPVRQREAEELQANLDRDVPIHYDPVTQPSKNKIQRWRNGRTCWEAADPESDWHMVIQDDALVAPDLIAGLEKALDVLGPDGLVSAYTGEPRPDQSAVIRAIDNAQRHRHAWMCTRSLCWGLAIIAPTRTIPDMLAWCERDNKAKKSNYDMLIGTYYRDVMLWRTWYTMPSLVEHREGESLVGHTRRRVAHEMAPGSALDIDWTKTPTGGLTVNTR